MTGVRVVGIDPSSDATGVALPDGRTVVLTPHRSNLSRPERLSFWARRIEAIVAGSVDLVVYEDIGGGGSRFAMAAQSAGGLRSLAEVECYRASVPMVLVHPNALKRYATGNGNADKAAMLAAAQAAAEHADCPPPATHDAADAWLLWALGVHALEGVDLLRWAQGDDPGHRLEVVAAHTWPKVGA